MHIVLELNYCKKNKREKISQSSIFHRVDVEQNVSPTLQQMATTSSKMVSCSVNLMFIIQKLFYIKHCWCQLLVDTVRKREDFIYFSEQSESFLLLWCTRQWNEMAHKHTFMIYSTFLHIYHCSYYWRYDKTVFDLLQEFCVVWEQTVPNNLWENIGLFLLSINPIKTPKPTKQSIQVLSF